MALALVFLAGGLLIALPRGSALVSAVRAEVADQSTGSPLQASVTLFEAHGDFALGPIQSDSSGVAVFHPPAGTYQFAVSLTGYFSGTTGFFQFNGSALVDQIIAMRPYLGTNQKLTVNTEPGATVSVVEKASRQLVAAGKANATGVAVFNLWSTPFSIMINKTAKETYVYDSVTPPTTVTTTLLNNSVKIFGWVRDNNGALVTSGVSAYLFDEDTTKPLLRRLIAANVTASNIRFDAYAGTYTIIVAADGFAPTIGHHVRFTGLPNPLPLNGTYANNVTLKLTPQTTVKTAIQFPSGDWSTFKLTRSVVVSEGGPVEGLPFGYVRDSQLQMALWYAFTFGGNPNYNAGPTEANALQARLIAAGANNLTTATFISVDDKTYRNSSFTVAPVSVWANNGSVAYGITANYVLTSGSIPFSATSNYFINTSLRQDRASRVVNSTYTIQVPLGFDRSQVDAPGATVVGFAPIMIDPLAGPGYTRVNIVVKPSKSGDAYGRVIGPTDRIWEVNKDLLNYKAIVSYQVDIQFSAQDSTYPNAPDLKAFPDFTYTWIFDPGDVTGSTRTGFKPTYKYSVAKEYAVNLTVTYPNMVKSMRTLTVDVDGVPPTIGIQVNSQSGDQTVNQNDHLRFQAVNYVDYLWTTPPPGMLSLVVRGYEWNFNTAAQPTKVDATSPTVDWTYNNPGTYLVTLRAIDGAGLKSANRTVTITVRDTTKPVIVLTVKQTDNQATVTTFMEGVNYTYDASATTDNVDPLSKLTFSWAFGDGAQTTGVIVTHVYVQYGDYKFSLAVKDTSGNTAYLNKTYTIAPDFTIRPDLSVKDLVISPRQPQESTFLGSSSVTVSLDVSNIGGADARNITINVVAFLKGQSAGAPTTVTNAKWTLPNGNTSGPTLAKGETKHVVLTWPVGAAGNWTIRVNVTDSREPPQKLSDNTVLGQVEVFQASWKTPALVGGIVVVVAGIPGLLFVRRRMRARAEEGGEEEDTGERLTRRRRAERRKQKEEEEKK